MHSANAIHKHLLQAKKIMVVPHQNPDGDAIGSATAFHEYLKSFGKDALIFCVTPLNHKLNFVPNGTPVYCDPVHFEDREIDTIVTVDSGDLHYSGIDIHLKNHPATLINIDHHATNEKYGHLNLVVPTAASTTEVLFHYFRHLGVPITPKMATSLLTGLVTDTGNFTNAATSSTALEAVSELILSGANLNLVTQETLKNKSVPSLRLWGKALSRLEKFEEAGLTYTYLTEEDLTELKVGASESEGISNFLSRLENSPITLLLIETPGETIKGSFRTTRDDIDVSEFAKKLGGGGHKKAAGFSQKGKIPEVLKNILTIVSHKH